MNIRGGNRDAWQGRDFSLQHNEIKLCTVMSVCMLCSLRTRSVDFSVYKACIYIRSSGRVVHLMHSTQPANVTVERVVPRNGETNWKQSIRHCRNNSKIQSNNRRNRDISKTHTLHTFLVWYRHFNKKWRGWTYA